MKPISFVLAIFFLVVIIILVRCIKKIVNTFDEEMNKDWFAIIILIGVMWAAGVGLLTSILYEGFFLFLLWIFFF